MGFLPAFGFFSIFQYWRALYVKQAWRKAPNWTRGKRQTGMAETAILFQRLQQRLHQSSPRGRTWPRLGRRYSPVTVTAGARLTSCDNWRLSCKRAREMLPGLPLGLGPSIPKRPYIPSPPLTISRIT